MANAGFYFDRYSLKRAKIDLEVWCEKYLASMLRGYVISAPVATPFLLGTQAALWRLRKKKLSICRYPETQEIYSLLSGSRVFVVSPMANIINSQMASGNIYRLFKDYDVPHFTANSIAAPVSVWPNRPSTGWQKSFNILCNQVDKGIEKMNADLFIASCGCYGLPVCDYVSTKYGIRSLYIGNAIHSFFGIRQSSTSGFMAGRRNEEFWMNNDLKNFKSLGLIDGGRYI